MQKKFGILCAIILFLFTIACGVSTEQTIHPAPVNNAEEMLDGYRP
jgi:hypothetical protein